MNLYIEIDRPKTPMEVIFELYSIKSIGMINAKATYYDEKCTVKQCESKRLRSFDDLLLLIRSYFPDITPKQLFHILITIPITDTSGSRAYLHMSNCSTIRRIRSYYYTQLDTCIEGYSCSHYDSQYSWVCLLNMLGLIGPTKQETCFNIKNYILENKPETYEKI